MPYYQFSKKYVINAGGSRRYQSEFLNAVNIAIDPEIADNSVYLYNEKSQQVYLSRYAYVTICEHFPEMLTDLIKIKKLNIISERVDANSAPIIIEHLFAIIPNTVSIGMKLCCKKTGITLASFRENDLVIYETEHDLTILDAIDRFR